MKMSGYLFTCLFVSCWINSYEKDIRILHAFPKQDRGVAKATASSDFLLSYLQPDSEIPPQSRLIGRQDRQQVNTDHLHSLVFRVLASDSQKHESARDQDKLAESSRWFLEDVGYKLNVDLPDKPPKSATTTKQTTSSLLCRLFGIRC